MILDASSIYERAVQLSEAYEGINTVDKHNYYVILAMVEAVNNLCGSGQAHSHRGESPSTEPRAGGTEPHGGGQVHGQPSSQVPSSDKTHSDNRRPKDESHPGGKKKEDKPPTPRGRRK